MEYPIPQFIEREPKIVGPFTFHQLIFVALAGGACFILYFLVGKRSFASFIVIAIVLFGAALALAFLRVGGYSLPVFLKNFFSFVIMPKIFLWQRKFIPPKFIKPQKLEKMEATEESKLKIVEKSNLQRLSVKVETKK